MYDGRLIPHFLPEFVIHFKCHEHIAVRRRLECNHHGIDAELGQPFDKCQRAMHTAMIKRREFKSNKKDIDHSGNDLAKISFYFIFPFQNPEQLICHFVFVGAEEFGMRNKMKIVRFVYGGEILS